MEKLLTFNENFSNIKKQLEKFSIVFIDNIKEFFKTEVINKDLEVRIVYDRDDKDFCGIYRLYVTTEKRQYLSIAADFSQSDDLIEVKIRFDSDNDDICRDVSFICRYPKLEIELSNFLGTEYVTKF